MPTYVLSKVKRTSPNQKTGDLVDQDHPADALETLDDDDEFLVLDVTGDAKVFKVITRAHMIAQLNTLLDASWAKITGKPSTFPPSAHAHAYSAITGKPDTFPPSAHAHAYSEITGKPAAYVPTNASDSERGVVELANETEALAGTDTSRAMTAAGVRAVRDALLNSPPAALDTLNELAAALGDDANFATTIAAQIAKRGTNADHLVSGTVTLARGGTGASTKGGARTALGLGSAATKNTGKNEGQIPVLGRYGVFPFGVLGLGNMAQFKAWEGSQSSYNNLGPNWDSDRVYFIKS